MDYLFTNWIAPIALTIMLIGAIPMIFFMLYKIYKDVANNG
jgi:hypothetical protein